MKRISTVILAIIYLAYTSGITVYQHYCMGELQSVSLIFTGDGPCGKCGMEKHTGLNSGCCKDVTIASPRSEDSHLSTYFAMLIAAPALVNILSIYDTAPISFLLEISTPDIPHHPPPIELPLFLRYQNFRI
ncbi:HYC_CC_PP family protein [Chitinophaga cymbidii]|uniref:HYC_CC_PP family protein n=1 Tax=Chitinophaga cymbidii TaxID=1096750 RepID=UPI003FCCAC3A